MEKVHVYKLYEMEEKFEYISYKNNKPSVQATPMLSYFSAIQKVFVQWLGVWCECSEGVG